MRPGANPSAYCCTANRSSHSTDSNPSHCCSNGCSNGGSGSNETPGDDGPNGCSDCRAGSQVQRGTHAG
jgi:hypothetical protein